MGKPADPEERKNVCLRTTADVLNHALKQMDYCMVVWPEYLDDAVAMRKTVERITEHARRLGFVGE